MPLPLEKRKQKNSVLPQGRFLPVASSRGYACMVGTAAAAAAACGKVCCVDAILYTCDMILHHNCSCNYRRPRCTDSISTARCCSVLVCMHVLLLMFCCGCYCCCNHFCRSHPPPPPPPKRKELRVDLTFVCDNPGWCAKIYHKVYTGVQTKWDMTHTHTRVT